MDSLGKYIRELLKEKPKVYLPGIGIFKKERVPAVFDENTNSFLAPSQKIVLINEKDSLSLLINTIKKKEGISEEESERKLKELVGSILLELNEKGEYTIDGLGKLIKTEEAISFTQESLEESLPLYKPVSEIKLIAPLNEEAVVTPEATKDEDHEALTPVSDEFEPEGRSINWLWPCIIILILIGAGVLWYFNPNILDKKRQSINNEPVTNILYEDEEQLMMPSDSISKSDTSTRASADSLSLAASENEDPIIPEVTFEIIIVSFGKLAEAERYVEDMNAKGYNIRILENRNPGNLFKVSYASFNDEAEAQLKLDEVRKELSKDAWVYKHKNY